MHHQHVLVTPVVVPDACPAKLIQQLAWVVNLARQQPRGSYRHRMLLVLANTIEDRIFELGIILDAPEDGPIVSHEEHLLLQQFDLD
ncbi:MAG: hypothetical protein Q7S23_04540 [bacterium]|nr:hypothetical protein [bacterium]